METNIQDIFTLHRYYIWANAMRTSFDKLLNSKMPEERNNIELTMYMSLWYAQLFVVIEGWKILELSDSRIDELLKSKNVQLLQNYRHGVFHFHKNYNDVKFEKFYLEGTTVVWVRQVSKEFGRWFLEKLQKNPTITSANTG